MKDHQARQEGIDSQHYLLRILFRGMVIDAQARNGRVVDLAVRADKKHSSTKRRFLQHLSNAIYRAGDLLNPRNNDGLPRVVERVMVAQAANDSHADRTDFYVVNRLPVHLPNGDASYEAFSFYEGIENKKLGLLGAAAAGFGEYLPDSFRSCGDRLNKCTGDLHIFPDDEAVSADGNGPQDVSIEACSRSQS